MPEGQDFAIVTGEERESVLRFIKETKEVHSYMESHRGHTVILFHPNGSNYFAFFGPGTTAVPQERTHIIRLADSLAIVRGSVIVSRATGFVPAVLDWLMETVVPAKLIMEYMLIQTWLLEYSLKVLKN